MAVMYRPPSLETRELVALYGRELDTYSVRDDDCYSEEYELDSEEGRGIRKSLSLEICTLQREDRARHVYFSNQEYYWRLEELRKSHLRNMAELERMYIGQDRLDQEDDGGLDRENNGKADDPISLVEEGGGSMPARRLQRINSQEELDFHDTSSGSDRSELLCGEDSLSEPDLRLDHSPRTHGKDRTFGRHSLLNPVEGKMAQRQFRFQPKVSCLKPQRKPSRQAGVRVRPISKVTVPAPFQMMLREEERKRHRVRTRSEVELENTLLRRELEELRECRKQFRASPAPAHIRLPLYEVINRRSGHRGNRGRSNRGGSNGGRDTNGNRASSAAASPRPFSFLERERRKKEARIVAELGNLAPKEECQVFKARPLPSSVYGPRHRGEQRSDPKTTRPQHLILSSAGMESTEHHGDTSPDPEPERHRSAYTGGTWSSPRGPSTKPVKKQIEVSIEMVKEREWSYIDPLETTRCGVCSSLQPGGQDPALANKNEYISV